MSPRTSMRRARPRRTSWRPAIRRISARWARALRAAASNNLVLRSDTPQYRLYEVQNGNHIENYKFFYPQLEYILPHAQKAFDLLVANVEGGAALPPDQCIPRGGAIAGSPT